jgi:predicted methyltransferase
MRSGDWKYLVTKEGSHLFDLATDPGEKHDRKAEQRGVFERLERKYVAWEKEMLPPIPLVPSEG